MVSGVMLTHSLAFLFNGTEDIKDPKDAAHGVKLVDVMYVFHTLAVRCE